VPPTCSNCGANDFVWANELKTGMTGGGTLSLRSRGEIPFGTRICRTCGHADLFLRDLAILRQPHNWRPGEFVPITPKPAPAKPPAAHAHPPPAPAPPPPPPEAPPPAPYALTAPPNAPLAAAPAVSGETEAARESDPQLPGAESTPISPMVTSEPEPLRSSNSPRSSGAGESSAPKPKTGRKRSTKSRGSSDS
jgi:hypothetical protein